MLAYYLNPLDFLFGSMARRGTLNQVAMGGSLGMVLGVTPIFSGLWVLALLLVLVFNVSLRMAIVVAVLMRALSFAVLDQYVSYPLGYWVIEELGAGGQGLGAVFKVIGETPVLAWTGGHHWYAGGAAIFALLAFVPFYYGTRLATTGARRLVRRLAKRLTLKGLKQRRLLRWVLWLVAPSVLYAFYDAAKDAQDAIAEAGEDIEEADLAELLERSDWKKAAEKAGAATTTRAVKNGEVAASGEASGVGEAGYPELEKVEDLDDLDLDDDFAPGAAAGDAAPKPSSNPAAVFAQADAEAANEDDDDDDGVDFEAVTRPRKRGKAEEKAATALAKLQEEQDPDKQVKAEAKAEKKIGKAAGKVADKEEKAREKVDKGRRADVAKASKKKKPKRPPGRLRKLFVIPLAIFVLLPAVALAGAYVMRDAIVKWAIEGPTANRLEMTITLDEVDFDIANGVIKLSNVVMQPHQDVPEGRAINGIDPHRPLFQATELFAELDLEQLFKGRLHFTLRAEDPTLTLVRMPDGSMSYASAAGREAGPLGQPRPAQPAQRVHTPEGEPAIVVDEQGRELHVFRDDDGERILAEKHITAEGETEWVWTDEAGEQHREVGEAPMVEEREADEYDPDRSSTFDEIRRFIERMIDEYSLDDPETWKRGYTTAQHYYSKYGPHVRKALQRSRKEDGSIDEEELERIAERFLLGSATYVEEPAFEPAPNLPRVWMKEFSITNLTVNYVDLRPEEQSAWSQDAYSLHLRNLATNRELLGKPTLALLSRGLANEEVKVLVEAALEAEPEEETDEVEILLERATARALATRLHLHIEHGLELNDIAGLFDKEAMPFEGGSIKVYTAFTDLSREDWFSPEVWYFHSATGEPRQARLPRAPVDFVAADMDGVLVIELEGVRLAAGAFGLPHGAIRFVNEVLGDEAEADWRFVLELSGNPSSPRVRLVNEPELLARLRLLAVRAVTRLAQDVTGKALELMHPVIDWERFEQNYLAGPEVYIVWEHGILDSAALLEALEVAEEATRQRVEPVVLRLRNVVSPLLFADHRELFLYNLGHNAVQVLVIVARDKFDEVASTVLDALLEAVALGDSDEEAKQRRADMRNRMIAGVAEELIPELEISVTGDLRLASGEPYDFQHHLNGALGLFRLNVSEVIGEEVTRLIREFIETIVDEVGGRLEDVLEAIPQAMFPRDFDRTEIPSKLRRDIELAVAPEVHIDENLGVTVDLDWNEAQERARAQLVTNAVGILQELTDGYIDAAIRFLDGQIGEYPPDYPREEVREDLRFDVAEELFPYHTDDRGMPVLSVRPERGQSQLVANMNRVVPRIAPGLVDRLLEPIEQAMDELFAPIELPEGWTMTRVAREVREGVLEAYLTDQPIHFRDGAYALSADREAAVEVAEHNAIRVASEVAQVLVQSIVEGSVEQVMTLVPSLPPGYTPERVAEEIGEGVGEASVRGERPGELVLDFEAGAERADANGIAVLRGMADVMLADQADHLAFQIASILDPLPEGHTRASISAQLTEGVGAEFVRGERLSTVVLDEQAGLAQLARNASLLGRELAEPMLMYWARGMVAPLAEQLEPYGEQFALTPEDFERATADSVRGVGAVLFAPGTVTLSDDGTLVIEMHREEAQRMLADNVEVEIGKLITLSWRRHVVRSLERTINPLLTEETRERRGRAYWATRAVWVVPSTFGTRWLRAADDEARAQHTEGVTARLEAVIDEESAQAMLDQVTRMLATRGVEIDPPLTTEEMTEEEREAYRNAQTPQQRTRVVRDFMKRNDRVLDAIAQTVPGAEFLPAEERRRRARDLIDRLD